MSSTASGLSLVLAIARIKISCAVAPEPSAAITLIFRLPTSLFSGVPLKVPVVASKDSQDGRAEPSASVAL
jgi:hypothetical protein